jgi:TonB-linked SusC/RagA family outer membrane protein
MKKIGIVILLLHAVLWLQAQQKTISGTIKDEQGNPIPFATILETGTRNAAQADASGSFILKIRPNGQLTITALGYESQTVPVNDNLQTITLVKKQTELEAVVVTTALGVKRQAREIGYAATSVTNKTLVQGRSVNVQQALNGKVSGMSITSTNTSVFENAKINIRGIRSLTGNNQPMLVIDGVPTPLNFLYSIPANDIQDITVLKSAASAAIYGPDAVNGVIVVTTKKGTGNKLNVTVSSTLQLTRVAYFPKLQHRFGGGAGEVVDPYGNYGYVPYENQLYGAEFDGSIQPIGVRLPDGSIQEGPYSDLHKDDKIKFWNTGKTWQNAISIAGQDFYFSVDDAKIDGMTPKDENRRTSFRFNGAKKAGRLSVNYGLNYILQNYNILNDGGVGRQGGLANLFPRTYSGGIFFAVLQNGDNIPLLGYKDWRNNKFAQYDNYYNGYALNPYWVIDNMRQTGRNDNLIGNINVNYQLFPWLKANAIVSSNLNFHNNKYTTAPIFVSDWARRNRDGTQYAADRPGSVFDGQSYSARLNLDYFLNGDRTFSDYTLRYTAGGSMRQDRSKTIGLGGNNLVVPYLYNVSTRSGDAYVPADYNRSFESRLYSFYGSVGMGYKDWAFLELTGRNDWDSRLLKENRSFFYPAANASVILSDAIPALKDQDVLSYAKLRASWSKSGNVNVGVYALDATYYQPTGFPYGNNVGFTAEEIIPNPDLKPEFIFTKEVGIELGFAKNRINIEATYFHQNSTNQILAVTQSATTGYSLGLANAAGFKNYGVETDVSLTPLVNIGKGRIDLKFNATYNDNQVTTTMGNIPVVIGGTGEFVSVGGNSPTANNIAIVGKPAFAFQLGDYRRDEEGRVIVDAETGNPSISSDMVVLGRSLPVWILGITPSFSLGKFSFSMTWDYKGGHNFYAGLGPDMDFSGISARSAAYGRRRFVFPNSVIEDPATGKYIPNTNVQVQDGNYGFWTGSSTNYGIATNYFASAASWRLREVNISYDLPLRWLGNNNIIKKATVSLVGRNLILLVPKSNQWGDPEFNSATGQNTFGLSSSYQSPASRLFGGSITVQF